MAKPIELSALKTSRSPRAAAAALKPGPAKSLTPREGFQVRWPPEEIKRMKRAAVDQGMNMSDFTLECFQTYMGALKAEKGNK